MNDKEREIINNLIKANQDNSLNVPTPKTDDDDSDDGNDDGYNIIPLAIIPSQ